MIVTVDEQGAIPAALAESEIVDCQHTWSGGLRQADLTSQTQQGGRTGRHGLMLALASTSFAAERECQVLQGSSQAGWCGGQPGQAGRATAQRRSAWRR